MGGQVYLQAAMIVRSGVVEKTGAKDARLSIKGCSKRSIVKITCILWHGNVMIFLYPSFTEVVILELYADSANLSK